MLRDKIEIIEDIIYNKIPNDYLGDKIIINNKEWNENIHKTNQIYNNVYLNENIFKYFKKKAKLKMNNNISYSLPILKKENFIKYLNTKGIIKTNEIISNVIYLSEIFGLQTEIINIENIGEVFCFKQDLHVYREHLEYLLKTSTDDLLLKQHILNYTQDFAYKNSTFDSIIDLLETSILIKPDIAKKIWENLNKNYQYKIEYENYKKLKKKLGIFIFILIIVLGFISEVY